MSIPSGLVAPPVTNQLLSDAARAFPDTHETWDTLGQVVSEAAMAVTPVGASEELVAFVGKRLAARGTGRALYQGAQAEAEALAQGYKTIGKTLEGKALGVAGRVANKLGLPGLQRGWQQREQNHADSLKGRGAK
jgi:hypothetical protein